MNKRTVQGHCKDDFTMEPQSLSRRSEAGTADWKEPQSGKAVREMLQKRCGWELKS
jgi:hypothetical protein